MLHTPFGLPLNVSVVNCRTKLRKRWPTCRRHCPRCPAPPAPTPPSDVAQRPPLPPPTDAPCARMSTLLPVRFARFRPPPAMEREGRANARALALLSPTPTPSKVRRGEVCPGTLPRDWRTTITRQRMQPCIEIQTTVVSKPKHRPEVHPQSRSSAPGRGRSAREAYRVRVRPPTRRSDADQTNKLLRTILRNKQHLTNKVDRIEQTAEASRV